MVVVMLQWEVQINPVSLLHFSTILG